MDVDRAREESADGTAPLVVTPAPGSQRDESRWLAALKQGHPVALDELSRTYRARIVRLAVRYVRDLHDAEDLAQEVLLKVWRHVGRFQGESGLWPWMARITINAAISHLRSQRRHPSLAAIGTAATDAGVSLVADPRDAHIGADDQALLTQFLERATLELRRLPPVYRGAVMLMDFRQYSTAEASRSLGIPIATVKSRAIRGRRLLRRALAAYEGGFGLREPSL